MSSDSDQASEWFDLAKQMSQRFSKLNDHVLDNLRFLLNAGRKIVGCAESALLVPEGDGAQLRFLVSVNSRPGVAEIVTEISVPCDGSIVGCVFNTGQLMAVAKPEEFYKEVAEKTGVSMNVYLVTPIVSGEEVIGVATFLNRPDEQEQDPFTPKEIEGSAKIADLAAASLKYHRRLRLQNQLFQRDLASVAQRLSERYGFDYEEGSQPWDQEISEPSALLQAMIELEEMTPREQDLAAEMIGVLSRYSESDQDY